MTLLQVPWCRMGHQANGIYIPPGSQREKHRVLPLYHVHAVAQKSPCERNRVIMGEESALKLGPLNLSP